MNKKTANKKYNPNSNITHLRRMGKSLQGAACIDDVSFSYSGNQLIAAQDAGTPASLMGDAFHFVDGDDDYYDSNMYTLAGKMETRGVNPAEGGDWLDSPLEANTYIPREENCCCIYALTKRYIEMMRSSYFCN